MIKNIGFVVLSLMLLGCEPEAVIFHTQEIPNQRWAFSEPVRFSTEISDTISGFNHYLLIRQGGDYAYQNLLVFVKTYYPNNTYMVDTFDCPLAAPNGQWLGSGIGDVFDNKVLVKMNEVFPQGGTYNFEIQHAMRPDTIDEVFDIGLKVERTQ